MSAIEPGISAAQKTAITNVLVFDGNKLTGPRSVVIDGNVIGSDPIGATEIIDGQGGVLIPGLIDSHVHVDNDRHLLELMKHGVTTALAIRAIKQVEQLRKDQSPQASPVVQFLSRKEKLQVITQL